jgi:hypothetical protein
MKSLVLFGLAALSACGGEPGSLFTASGVSSSDAGGPSVAGGSGASGHGDGAHSSAGSVGNAGGNGTPSACDGKITKPAALIADFEHGVVGWSSYMGNSGNTVFGGVQNTQPGAATTAFAATFGGGKAETSGMFHTQYCSNVSGFDGVSFWAKGRGGDRVRFLAVVPATDPTSGFGDCNSATSVCSDHPGMPLRLTDQWQAYHVAWNELAQVGWGTPAKFAGILNAVLWINEGPVEEFEFSIDQVELYKGDPLP